jgi:hypothetical protein
MSASGGDFRESNTPDRSGSLAQQKTIEAPEAILTLGKHGGRTAETVSASPTKADGRNRFICQR